VREKLHAISKHLDQGSREARAERRQVLEWARRVRRVVLARSLLAEIPIPAAPAGVESPREQVLLVLRLLQVGLHRDTIASVFSELTGEAADSGAATPAWRRGEWWDGKGAENASAVIESVKRWVRQRARERELLSGTGVQVFGRNATPFARIMGLCFGYFGLRTRDRRPRTNDGSRVRHYSIAPESVSFMQALVIPYWNELRSPSAELPTERALKAMRKRLAILKRAGLKEEYEEFAGDNELQEDIYRLLQDRGAGHADDPVADDAEDLLRAVRPTSSFGSGQVCGRSRNPGISRK